jgi:transcriptional regulator of arginine metabolism
MSPSPSPGQRRKRIRALLCKGEISTQEELREALRKERIDVTQATLSRDLRALRARRVTSKDGQMRYEVPEEGDDAGERPSDQVAAMVDWVARNDSLIVVHTAPGAASAVARAIDLARLPGVLGSLAGDDTIFIAPASPARLRDLERRLLTLFATS